MKKKIILIIPILLFVMLFLVNCDKDKCKKNCDTYRCNIKIHHNLGGFILLDTTINIDIRFLNDNKVIIPFETYNQIDLSTNSDTIIISNNYTLIKKDAIIKSTGAKNIALYSINCYLVGDSIFFNRHIGPDRTVGFQYSIYTKGIKL